MGTYLTAHKSFDQELTNHEVHNLEVYRIKSQRMHSINKSSFEMLTHQIDVLKELTKSNACIVVEGKNDKAALKNLGIDANFYCISGSGKSIQKLAEEISHEKEVIILTDFDKKGGILASKIVEKLNQTAEKTKINLQVRRNLLNSMQKTKVGEIQDLPNLLKKGDDIHGENRRNSHKIHNQSKDRRRRSSRKTRRHRSYFWPD